MPLRVSSHTGRLSPRVDWTEGLLLQPQGCLKLQTSLRFTQTTHDAFQRPPAWLKQCLWILMQNQYEIFILSVSVRVYALISELIDFWINRFGNEYVMLKNTKDEHDIFRKAPRKTELRSAAILYPLCSILRSAPWTELVAQVKESLETEVDKFCSIVLLLCIRMISVAAQFPFLQVGEWRRDQRFLNAVILSNDKIEVLGALRGPCFALFSFRFLCAFTWEPCRSRESKWWATAQFRRLLLGMR